MSTASVGVDVMTTEYVDGVARKVTQKFRAYDSYADAFQDYGRLMLGNKRYAGLLGQTDGTAFAQGLQRAGYATDPNYAGSLLLPIIAASTVRIRRGAVQVALLTAVLYMALVSGQSLDVSTTTGTVFVASCARRALVSPATTSTSGPPAIASRIIVTERAGSP